MKKISGYSQDLSFPPRVMSGIQPCNNVHLGHYFGALKNQIILHHKYPGQTFYMIADYHSLTRDNQHQTLTAKTIEIATTYLALGLDPSKAFLYRQSDVPEILELSWILNCITSFSILNKAPSFKSAPSKNRNSGLLTYPVLMASDVLSVKANIVPVGKDQLPYIEIVRDLAQKINNTYPNIILPIPTPYTSDFQLVKGIDGQKMSLNYNNVIPLFNRFQSLREKIKMIVTDSQMANEKKDYKNCNVFHLYSMVAKKHAIEQMKEDYTNGSISYQEAKEKLLLAFQQYFGEFEETYIDLKKRPNYVMDVLREGFKPVQQEAKETLMQMRDTIGIKKSILL